MRSRAKSIADLAWEKARVLVELIAPEVPVDQEPLDDHMSWHILEDAALSVSPETWDNPEALKDLIALRKRFAPQLHDENLAILAKAREKEARARWDPSITPASDKFEAMAKRLGVQK